MRKDTQKTRDQLIEAAETLFSDNGIDNVTMLDIGRAANQGNRNAPSYHFGTKENILNAVLDKHSLLINEKRKVLLDKLDGKKKPTAKDLIEALVLPIVSELEDQSGKNFVKINSQLMSHESYSGLRWARTESLSESVRLSTLIKEKLSSNTKQERQSVTIIIDAMLFQGLCSFISTQPITKGNLQAFTSTLIESMEAVLAKCSRKSTT